MIIYFKGDIWRTEMDILCIGFLCCRYPGYLWHRDVPSKKNLGFTRNPDISCILHQYIGSKGSRFKVNCGACIECKEVFVYENENIVSSNQMDKFLKISQLKKDIKAGKEVSTRKHIYMKLPREGVHSNHPVKCEQFI